MVERLGRGERDVHPIEVSRAEALPPTLVEDETRELRAVAVRLRDDLLCPGHLRDALVAHEAHGFDARKAGRREPVDEVGADGGRQGLGLVLEPVPRPNVANDHAHVVRLRPQQVAEDCNGRGSDGRAGQARPS